jgi:hypothetical protein
VSELNPNHAVTRSVSDHWHKIAALLVAKLGGHAVISAADIAAVDGKAVAVRYHHDGIHVTLISMDEAERLARKEGGLPE